MKKNKDFPHMRLIIFAIVVTLITVILPIIINCLFKLESSHDFLVAEWDAGDALAFCGAIISSFATIVGVFLSIEYAQRNYREDEVNRVKPYFSLNHYNTRLKLNLTPSILTGQNMQNEHEPSEYYKEIKPNKVKKYIVIEESGIRFQDTLTDENNEILKSGGHIWRNRGNTYGLEAVDYISIPFEAENIGNGASTITKIVFYKAGDKRRGINLFTIKQGDSFDFHIFCADRSIALGNTYIVELIYNDILGNCYSQKYPLSFKKDPISGEIHETIDLTGKQELNKEDASNGQTENGNS